MGNRVAWQFLAILAIGTWIGFVCAPGAAVSRSNTAEEQKAEKQTTAVTEERPADQEAIRKAAREFAEAFAKGDAKAVAAHWTADGEFGDDSGMVLRRRASLEKAFADFFKAKPGARIVVEIESIRFPSRDTAIERGVNRQFTDGADLPVSTEYTVFHVREEGKWKIAVCQEWGSDQDRLHDLEWLLGTWKGSVKDQELVLTFSREKDRPLIAGQFTKKASGKVVASGDLRIRIDPETGQLRSWHFDDDGGHGQALWTRDGRSWIQEASGVSADGTNTSAVNILTRVSKDDFTWRSVNRMVSDLELPDTRPVKLTRVATAK